MRECIGEAEDDVWQVVFPLWDTLFRRPIQGVKIYRSDVARRFPYRAVRHCETDQVARASEAGYRVETRGASSEHDEHLMGSHLVLDERTAFWNCMDRAMRWKWMEEGGDVPRNWMSWVLPYFHLFLERYVTERDPLLLYAWAGLVSGLSQPVPDDWEEKDARRPPEGFELLQRILAMDERDWRKVGLPHHEREGLDALARRLARPVGNRSWQPSWRCPDSTSRRSRWSRRIRRLVGRPARWLAPRTTRMGFPKTRFHKRPARSGCGARCHRSRRREYPNSRKSSRPHSRTASSVSRS